jgi:hypothetical protein
MEVYVDEKLRTVPGIPYSFCLLENNIFVENYSKVINIQPLFCLLHVILEESRS